ncbi:hypothetical protein D6851_15895 [Altericroceibacterium spongiae]|uniref:Uncharacterized protein n=1 Tax=Altericroceibacterium spongiae TaxID=2320269 RepID=A0A420EAL7_9SPHN|nr:hypothetical protein [Altericroceibacterium spongiae]RKF17739.1 hypothetical protein D6851_15895 [Altericroceibacterium spongiae]
MSRYEVPMKPEYSHLKACVGWDRPLQTFFLQVIENPDTKAEKPMLWIGTDYSELKTPKQALQYLQTFCDIPENLIQTLQIDRLKTIAREDGPAQLAARKFRSENK